MSKQQCEICGEMKSQQEMSKSYKHRCKECVARLTRIERQAAKQRAENLKQQLEGTGYTLSSPEDRRKERILIASFAMQGMIANDRFYDALLDKDMLKNSLDKICSAMTHEDVTYYAYPCTSGPRWVVLRRCFVNGSEYNTFIKGFKCNAYLK